MAKNYGVEFPERPLMAVLSDLLGIQHFTTSNGGTVRSDFLSTVLSALGGDPNGRRKDELIEACVEAATRAPFDKTLLSPGGTVTNQALQVIIDGLTEHGVPGRVPAHFFEVSDDVVGEELEFDPAAVEDERARQMSERAVRDGQDHFRTGVLEAYGGSCALTDANAVGALEAAHITPYLGPRTNVVSNGICLRADVHRLWDSGQIALDENTMRILLSDALKATSYADLDGLRARVPRRAASRPSPAALRSHREWCGL